MDQSRAIQIANRLALADALQALFREHDAIRGADDPDQDAIAVLERNVEALRRGAPL